MPDCQEAALQNLQSGSSLLQLLGGQKMVFGWFPQQQQLQVNETNWCGLHQPVTVTPHLPAPHQQADLWVFR